MKCASCDAANSDDSTVCIQCGKQLTGNTSAPTYSPVPNYPPATSAYGGVPTAPYYPGYPQAQPPNVYQPSMSGLQYPSTASYPPMPGSFTNQAGGPPMMPPQPAAPKKIAPIAKPLPLWIVIVGVVVTLVILALLSLTGGDWADRAMHTAIGAITIALLLLLFTGIRVSLGMLNEENNKRTAQIMGSALAIMLLFVYSGVVLVGQAPLHTLQARTLEGQRQWQQAINEYQLGGETAPTSANLAHTYIEWGNALSKSGDYAGAINKFNVVITNYTVTNEVASAQSSEIQSYLSLGNQAVQKKDYVSATKAFDAVLGQSFCHAACQNMISPEDATAYYNLAQSQLGAQQYSDAVNSFKAIQSHFASSPEAQKVHGPLATALLGKGKQDRANVCSSAIPTYQDLAANFSDTPEGQSAASELKQPQAVTGHFTAGLPTDGTVTAELVQNFNGTLSNAQTFAIVDNSPSTPINSDGTFTFRSISQGQYGLVWTIAHPNGSRDLRWYYATNDPTQAPDMVAIVGPLCPFDFGDIAKSLEP